MDRLTKNVNGKIEPNGGESCSSYCTSCGRADCTFIRMCLKRLSEYEDTGMEPLEILATKELCKRHARDAAELRKKLKNYEVEQKKKHIKMGNTIYHISPLLRTIFGAQIVHISYTREGVVIRDAMDCEIRMSDIGKTAFFSKEEAKKALEDMIDGTPY